MKIAVSGCLLGEKIRFDKGHKLNHFIVNELGKYAEFVSFCPENLAFGSPRPSIRMLKENDDFKIISNKDKSDLTNQLLEKSYIELDKIKSKEITGIIFKSKSPTCGLNSSKVYLENGFAEGKDDGVFASLCKKEFDYLPMEEEGRLADAWLRENFVMQLFAYDDFENFKQNADMKGLVNFHQSYKFLLHSKDERLYRELGNIVANHQKKSFLEILKEYESSFKMAISKKSSIGKTRNVLEHMAGFLKTFLDSDEKKMLHVQIEDFMHKIVPVIVPLSTLKIYVSKYNVEYLLGQKFLEPYPKELALRSDIKSVR
ncbi:YbgA family protein [Sulfurospirillum sp. 1307]